MPKQKLVKVGVWEDEVFIGVVLFGDGANQHIGKPYGLQYTEVCELVRVALRTHRAPVSRIVSIALKLLGTACPGLRLVVSFADSEQGHVGGIYQAGNWIYVGDTKSADEFIVNGKRWHGRALRGTRNGADPTARNVAEWARRTLDPNTQQVKGSSKRRYLYPLDSETRARVALLAKPYPKRERSRENAAAGPPAEGGVIPTRSLHPGQVVP